MNEDNGKPIGGLSIYDRISGDLQGNSPDRFKTEQSNCTTLTPVLHQTQTWIVQTIREREKGDYILLQYIGPDRTFQVALPPKVAERIARQRDALTAKSRRQAGKERAARDKAAGKLPGFLRSKKKAKAKKPAAAE